MAKHLVFVVLFTLAIVASGTNAKAAPIGSATLWEGKTAGLTSPARYYRLLQEIVEYDPTCRSATRFGQTTFVDLILEGELTVSFSDHKSVYRAGQTAIIPPGVTYWFGNEGKTKVRYQESFISPDWDGMPQVIAATPTCPGRVAVGTQRVSISKAPPVVDMIQQGADLDAGYVAPRQTVNALNLITVVGGEVTLRYDDGTTRRLAANQGGSLDIGKAVVVANEGTVKASYFITWLTAPDVSPTSTSPAPAVLAGPAPTGIRPPSTGDAGISD